jgi:2-polyprenyl-3-methyl-5-hydroxy-6-metoxy-1,4-benzoquinol methylase
MKTDERGLPTTNHRLAPAPLVRRPSDMEAHLLDTQRAFDSVAADYDGPRGNNALMQRMRQTVWQTMASVFPAGSRLLDLGCGTGIDAAYLARQGYEVVATDWSPQMVERTRARVASAGLSDWVTARQVGIHTLEQLGSERFDGIYSNFGPMNCVPDLPAVARSCAALLKPGGKLICSVMGRVCPWEFIYYLLRGQPVRAQARGARDGVLVPMNRQTVWTCYYTPHEFYRAFADQFALTRYRGLSLFLPPPYLITMYERGRPLFKLLGWLDDHLGALPLLRAGGDHFLVVMTKI